MKCPRMHGSLESVLLNADFSTPLQAYLCTQCHGVWMRALECRTYLGIECEKLVSRASAAPIELACAHCQTSLKVVSVPLDNGETVDFYICPRCHACFFDQTQFALIFYLQLKAERDISGILARTPLDNLGVVCCDCGSVVNQLEGLYDVGIGYCCQHCHSTPPILSENKLQTVQLVSFHNLEIKIEHFQNSTRSRIAVTPFEPCLFDASIFSLSPVQRMMKLGSRKLKFRGELGRKLDATEDMKHVTPWHVFLKQRGVVENLAEISRLGAIEVTFKPHIIAFDLNAKRTGTETKLKFEASVRRMLIAYEKFVQLSKMYSFQEDVDNESPEESLT